MLDERGYGDLEEGEEREVTQDLVELVVIFHIPHGDCSICSRLTPDMKLLAVPPRLHSIVTLGLGECLPLIGSDSLRLIDLDIY